MSTMGVIERTYSSYEAAELAGISYRMLDYWLRTGAVVIDAPATPGSGNRRRFTEPELQALIEVVTIYRSARAIISDFSSGALWAVARGMKEHTRER